MPTWSDVVRPPKFKMAATETVSGGRRPDSGNQPFCQCIDVSAWSQLMGSRIKLPLPVSLTAILNFYSCRTSGNEDSVKFKSGMTANMSVGVDISAPFPTVQDLFPLPV